MVISVNFHLFIVELNSNETGNLDHEKDISSLTKKLLEREVTHQFLLRCGQPNFNSPLSGC